MKMHKALHPRNDVDSMYQEKKEEDDLPVLKVAWIHLYEDWKTI